MESVRMRERLDAAVSGNLVAQIAAGSRQTLRSAALTALASWYKATGGLEALQRPRVQFLYLHDVADREDGALRSLLGRLSELYSFISYSDAVERVLTDNIDRPYASFSLDDGFKSCVRTARTLREFGASACFFLCPPMIGENDPAVVQSFCVNTLHVPPAEFMDWDDVHTLLEEGHEIGSHTLTHADLGRSSTQQLHDEIEGSRDMLNRSIGSVKHFAWPYGHFSHFSADAARIVFDAGFESCASATRGCHVAAPDNRRRLCIRRDNTVAKWPLGHMLYFMARNSATATASSGSWPTEWQTVID
jgi:peptidoglycan/xylan/chitin deacetylase (PgdA/CDA1 family)